MEEEDTSKLEINVSRNSSDSSGSSDSINSSESSSERSDCQ